jgi:hypothetical protein
MLLEVTAGDHVAKGHTILRRSKTRPPILDRGSYLRHRNYNLMIDYVNVLLQQQRSTPKQSGRT